MLSVSRLVIAGCSMAGLLGLALPAQAEAAKTLPPRIQTQVLNLLAAGSTEDNHCVSATGMGKLVGAHPEMAQQIAEFAAANLASRRDPVEQDCTCPVDLAVATIRAVPELTGPLKGAFEDRYPQCDSAIETAMEDSLSEIAPGAGGAGAASSMPLTARPKDETCRDPSSPGCGGIQTASTDGIGPNQQPGLMEGSSMSGADAQGQLSPELQAEILEALQAKPERDNQCIAANAYSALVQAHAELALAIMEFADLTLPSKGRILGDECVCPLELATATVQAIPELKVPVRRAMDDRYPECSLASLEPGAGGRRFLRPEPSCIQTASPSC